MAVASLVLGIVCIVLANIPLLNVFVPIPALVGLALAFAAWRAGRKAQKPRGMAVAGLTLNAVAIVLVIAWIALLGGILEKAGTGTERDWDATSAQDVIDHFKASGLEVSEVVAIDGIEMLGPSLGYALRIHGKDVMLLYYDRDNPFTGPKAEATLRRIQENGTIQLADATALAMVRGPFVLTDYEGHPKEKMLMNCFGGF